MIDLFLRFQAVKLNNPLMGTETLILFLALALLQISPVKLNNPLMGTETMFKEFGLSNLT